MMRILMMRGKLEEANLKSTLLPSKRRKS